MGFKTIVFAPKLTSWCSIIFFAPSVIATRIITDVIPITIPSEVNIVLGAFLRRFVYASKILSMIYESFIS